MRDPQKFIRKAIIDRLQGNIATEAGNVQGFEWKNVLLDWAAYVEQYNRVVLSLIHISEPTRPY